MRSRLVLGSFAAALVVFACGGSDSANGFDDGSFGADGGSSGGEGSSGSLGGGGGGSGGQDGGENGGVTNACATSTAQATKLPLHMVVVFDRSGSMCIYNEQLTGLRDCNSQTSRWQQVKNALISFFGATESAGITASLVTYSASGIIYTPSNSIPAADCQASTYATPVEANVALPDTQSKLATRLNGMTGAGGTPTRYALEGAVTYAQGVRQQLAGNGKVVIVLATDGNPEYCGAGNTIQTTSTVASGVAATIPTYVIGVGSSLTSLNAVAQAGGTNDAFIVSTATSAQIGQQFAQAMATIRGASLGCEYAIPAPPQGQTLDFGKVNVQFTPGGGGAPKTLTYSADCSNAEGWRYDNPQAPTKIMLCQNACTTAKADAAGKVDVVLGCVTLGGGPA